MTCIPCDHCTAVCCKYVAVPIDEPETRRDFDDIRWYLMHEGITVFVEDGDWYIQFATICRNLQADSRCGIYPTRPSICREYKAGECDYAGGDYGYDHLFARPEQIEEFARTRRLKKTTARKAGAPGRRNGRAKLGTTAR